MMTDMRAMQAELVEAIAGANDLDALEALRVAALGKAGSVSALLKTLGGMTPDERQTQGPQIHALREAVTNALIVTKCAYLPLNPDFDMDALKKQARVLNPTTHVFETDARNGQSIAELADWLCEMRDKTLAASAAL